MDGFINLNKALGISSHSAMAAVRRLLHVKAGHTGTLDPEAQGVLPLCIGKATRLSEYLMACEKSYRGQITLGITTDSYDAAGKIIEIKPASHVKEADVLALLPGFTGDILQKPPMVAAIKHQGQPLYKLARLGIELDRAPRAVKIARLNYLRGDFGGATAVFELEIACSKGTYIRSLAHDMGQALGTGAHLSALCRTRVGCFSLEDSYTFEEIKEMAERGVADFLFPVGKALSHMTALTSRDEDLTKLLHGNPVLWQEGLPEAMDEDILVNDSRGELLGVGIISLNEEGMAILKLKKVLVGG